MLSNTVLVPGMKEVIQSTYSSLDNVETVFTSCKDRMLLRYYRLFGRYTAYFDTKNDQYSPIMRMNSVVRRSVHRCRRVIVTTVTTRRQRTLSMSAPRNCKKSMDRDARIDDP